MSIVLRKLYEETKKEYDLDLIAGENGLDHIFTWIYLAEDIHNTSFLKPDNLIITTGLSCNHDPNWLKQFILNLISRNTCCLILNVGRYITNEDISQDIIDLCNQKNFPLFTMPWDIYISDIFQECCNRIFQHQQRTHSLAGTFRQIIRNDDLAPDSMEILESNGYFINDHYCLSVLDLDVDNNSYQEMVNQFEKSLSYSRYNCDFISFIYDKKLLLLWHNADEKYLDFYLQKLIDSSHAKSDFHIGISSWSDNLLNLQKTYQQAIAALIMAQNREVSYYHFDDFGCYQIFFSIDNKEVLYQFYRSKIGFLEDYDLEHQSNYLETLEYYLLYNGHLATIAEKLVCHRNTVYYRTNKIREWLHLDTDQGEEMFQLQLAINIRNFLQIFDPKNPL